jgi:hypothetical protein
MTLLRIFKNKTEFKRHPQNYFGSQMEFDFGAEDTDP